MNPDNDEAFNEFWRGLSPEEQLELIQQSLNEEIAAGRIVELLPVNGKRTYIRAEDWQQKVEQN